jgi:hypothetical protein
MTVPVSALEIFSNYKTKIKHSHKLSCFSQNTQGNYEKGEKKMSHTQRYTDTAQEATRPQGWTLSDGRLNQDNPSSSVAGVQPMFCSFPSCEVSQLFREAYMKFDLQHRCSLGLEPSDLSKHGYA